MSRYRLEMPGLLRDLIRHLPPELKAKVKAALSSIAADPYRAKELRDDLAGLRSYRIVGSRVIYRIVGSTVQIVALGPRTDIYERAATELSKKLRKGKGKTDDEYEGRNGTHGNALLRTAGIGLKITH